jgi:radical SAM superfamily enzyme YgiQ (UPF0313 family)
MTNRKKPLITFIRGPIFGTSGALNNEGTSCIAYAYLSAYVARHGYEMVLVDAIGEGLDRIWKPEEYPGYQCQGLTIEETLDRVPQRSGVLAFSAMFSSDWLVVRKLINEAHKRFPEALFVAGGEHVTALGEYVLRDCPALDVCVRGEGERKFLDLLEAWTRDGDYSRVSGISYLDKDGDYHQTDHLPRIREINDIPWPNWPEEHLQAFWEAGKSYGTHTSRDMPILASRGCPYQCTFCSSPQMWTTRYILRDVDDLIAEIKSYVARWNITSLQFYDLTAITKKRWTVEFCKKLLENGIRLEWSLPSGTRSEALDEEALRYLKESGCSYLVYAPESGSPETLKKIKKRVDLKTLTKSVLTARKLGITVRTNLIIGFPHEGRRHVFRTILYGLYLALRGVDEVPIMIFLGYPGTELFDELLEKGGIRLDDDYFLSLNSSNSDFTRLNPATYNDRMSTFELALYRILFMVLNYLIGYVMHPSRIIRTVRNFTKEVGAATVLEHRLKDRYKRKVRTAQT